MYDTTLRSESKTCRQRTFNRHSRCARSVQQTFLQWNRRLTCCSAGLEDRVAGVGVGGYHRGMVATTWENACFPCRARTMVTASICKRFTFTHPANTQINPGFTAARRISPLPVIVTKPTGKCNFWLCGNRKRDKVHCTVPPENVTFLCEKHSRGASIGDMPGCRQYTDKKGGPHGMNIPTDPEPHAGECEPFAFSRFIFQLLSRRLFWHRDLF